MNELAIVAVTPSGLELGRRIAQAVGHGEVLPAEGEVRSKLTEVFLAGRPLVCIMALGIVVRTLGPLAKNKVTDPPVVVVDEAGQFAISVLGGHVGGANELTKKVAKAYGVVDEDQPFASRWTFYIGINGRILDIDKQVSPTTHGKRIAAKLAELGIPRRRPGK